MRVFFGIAEFLLAVYFGVNWGFDHSHTPGGKVVLSIIATLVILLLILIVEVILGFVFRPRGRDWGGGARRVAPTYWATLKESEGALEALAARTRQKNAAIAQGVTQEEFDEGQREREAAELAAQKAKQQERFSRTSGTPFNWG